MCVCVYMCVCVCVNPRLCGRVFVCFNILQLKRKELTAVAAFSRSFLYVCISALHFIFQHNYLFYFIFIYFDTRPMSPNVCRKTDYETVLTEARAPLMMMVFIFRNQFHLIRHEDLDILYSPTF
jgi:hypothetical protein